MCHLSVQQTLPMILLESGEPRQRIMDYVAAPSAMRSLVDSLWSLAGYPRCFPVHGQSEPGRTVHRVGHHAPPGVGGRRCGSGVVAVVAHRGLLVQDRGAWFGEGATAPQSCPLELQRV